MKSGMYSKNLFSEGFLVTTHTHTQQLGVKKKNKNPRLSSLGKYSCWKLIKLQPKCWFASTTSEGSPNPPTSPHLLNMAKACSAERISTGSLLPARNSPAPHPPLSFLSVFGRILSDDWLSRVKGSRVHGSHFWPFVKHRDALFCKFCLRGSSAWRRRTRLDVFQHHIRLDSVSLVLQRARTWTRSL